MQCCLKQPESVPRSVRSACGDVFVSIYLVFAERGLGLVQEGAGDSSSFSCKVTLVGIAISAKFSGLGETELDRLAL